MSISLRLIALHRTIALEFVLAKLTEDQRHAHDVSSIVADLVVWSNTQDWEFTAKEWAEFIAPHEYDESGLTDAALAKALKNSQTGWVVMVRRPNEDVQVMNWENAKYEIPEAIEALVREFSRFPEGTSIMVLPLVG